MKRRNFIALFSVGWIANYLPVAIAMTYQTQPNSLNKGQPASENWQKVGTVDELDKTGQLLKEESPVGPILIVGTSKTKDLIAVNPTCPHMGCLVEWEDKEQIFVCPCHGSKFALDGNVIEGVAIEPLEKYKVIIESDSVLVHQE